MALIPKPSVNVRWAEGGNQLEPASEVQELGFVVEKPPYEIVNWLHNKHDTAISYLFQEGFPAWDIETEYSNTSYVKYAGKIYKSKLQNTGKQPDANPTIWEIAFANYQDFVSLQTDLNNTKTKAGHASNLVYKSAPSFTAKAIGTSYSANGGVGTNDGYQFNSHSRDGLFHNGTNPVVLNDGTTVASFSGNTTTPAAKDVVTFDMLKKYLEIYKVGDLYLTSEQGNPSDRLGYGVWSRYAEGRALVGYSSVVTSSVPDWVKTPNNIYGEYTVSLTEAQNGKHTHYFSKDQVYSTKDDPANKEVSYLGADPVGSTVYSGTSALEAIKYLKDSGSGAPHNNVQPSIVIFVWRRVS